MLISLGWRNLARNRRRSILAGAAVALGLFFGAWAIGLNEGAYAALIRQAAHTRIGHVQVLAEGYLDYPEARLVVPDGIELASRLAQLEHVDAVSARSQVEGVVARDSESAPVELIGVDPETERSASVIAERLLEGDSAVSWCRETMVDVLPVMGNNEELYGRWCDAMGYSRFLEADGPREVILGAGVAERLLVSVGDEITAQVVRAVDEDGPDGAQAGSLSQRRLEVVGIFRAGNPEVDDRAAYMARDTLMEMLGTRDPNEIVLVLDDVRYIDEVKVEAEEIVSATTSVDVHTWRERNPSLAAMIEMDSGNNFVMSFILCVLVIIGVVNATMMSVLERTKEFGVMLSLGIRPGKLFALVMTEVSLLGVLSCIAGIILGGAIELFGRYHGWYMEWFGYDPENIEAMSTAGLVYETVYYSALSLEAAIVMVVGMYLLFLLAGRWPAWRASRLRPVDAMRAQ